MDTQKISDALVSLTSYMSRRWVWIPAAGTTVCYLIIKKYYNSAYAWWINRMSKKMLMTRIPQLKSQLFQPMIAKAQEKLQKTKEEGLVIVEIGAGTGTNFKYYPEKSKVKCIEPKVEFEGYVAEEVKKNGEHLQSIEFVQGYGESFSKDFEPGSVDFVVATKVLCSVKDVKTVASEVKRVLKPGGMFLYMEHVYAPEGQTLQRIYLNCVTPVAIFCLDNCHWNREPWAEVGSVGFTSSNHQIELLSELSFFSPLASMCLGLAVK